MELHYYKGERGNKPYNLDTPAVRHMNVGLSNMLDREACEEVPGRATMEGTHREIVGAGLVSSELLTKVG